MNLSMTIRNGLLGLIAAVSGFIVITVAVTELLSRWIEFSLLLGLPSGVIGGIVLGVLTYWWLDSDNAGSRRNGATLAMFGVAFLVVLVSLVVVGDFRNSLALPIAGIVGVIAAIVGFFWLRQTDRQVTPPR